jgi:hypothetical protein
MQHHYYSTVATDEKRQAIAKVIDLAQVREAVGGLGDPPGMHGGMHRPETKKAARD